MTRAEKVIEARRLRAQGLTWQEVGARMGVARSTAHELVSDPQLSRHRDRRYRRGATCADCGCPIDWSHGEPSERCAPCNQRLTAGRERERWRSQRELVERLWAEGKTAREIADLLGWKARKPNVLIVALRKRGYDLPRRRTPEQIARMTADSDEHLAKARAVYRRQRRAAA